MLEPSTTNLLPPSNPSILACILPSSIRHICSMSSHLLVFFICFFSVRQEMMILYLSVWPLSGSLSVFTGCDNCITGRLLCNNLTRIIDFLLSCLPGLVYLYNYLFIYPTVFLSPLPKYFCFLFRCGSINMTNLLLSLPSWILVPPSQMLHDPTLQSHLELYMFIYCFWCSFFNFSSFDLLFPIVSWNRSMKRKLFLRAGVKPILYSHPKTSKWLQVTSSDLKIYIF